MKPRRPTASPNPRPRGRPFVFPDPGERSPNDPNESCAPEKVLGLYNQAEGNPRRVKICDRVRNWFDQEARKHGWMDTYWPKDGGTDYSAGCILSTVLIQVRPAPAPSPASVPVLLPGGAELLPPADQVRPLRRS